MRSEPQILGRPEEQPSPGPEPSPSSGPVLVRSIRPRSIRVIYIMGYGRSGSTLLDLVLGNHPQITSAGELSSYAEWRDRNLDCACGEKILDCAFWSAVEEKTRLPFDSETEQKLRLAVEPRRQARFLVEGRISPSVLSEYRDLMESRFQAIAKASGNSVIVDSSKSAGMALGRAYALQQHTGLDVRVIHLVRDGRGVVWSALKRPGSPERKPAHKSRFMMALRTSASWRIANQTTLGIAEKLDPGTVVRLRYEDFVAQPARELSRIGELAGMDLSPVIDKVEGEEPLAPGHNIAGNRLRFQGNIGLAPDFEWRERLSARYRLMQTFIAGKVARQFGYGVRGGDEDRRAG